MSDRRSEVIDDAILLAALGELGNFLSAMDVPEGVIATFPSLSDLQTQFFTTVLYPNAAADPGAADGFMRIEPTNLLLECLAAARAKDWPRFIVLVHGAVSGLSQMSLHHNSARREVRDSSERGELG